jgi:hypothetical protein
MPTPTWSSPKRSIPVRVSRACGCARTRHRGAPRCDDEQDPARERQPARAVPRDPDGRPPRRMCGGGGVLVGATRAEVRRFFQDAGHCFAGKSDAEISQSCSNPRSTAHAGCGSAAARSAETPGATAPPRLSPAAGNCRSTCWRIEAVPPSATVTASRSASWRPIPMAAGRCRGSWSPIRWWMAPPSASGESPLEIRAFPSG